MQDLILRRDVQVLLQRDFRRRPILLRHQGRQALRGLVQLRLHVHPLGEDRLIGARERGLGRGEVADIVAAQEGLIGPVGIRQLAFKGLTLGLDGRSRAILKDFTAIGQILVDDRVQHTRRQGRIVALVGQAHDRAQRRRRHVQTGADGAHGGGFLFGGRACGWLAVLEGLDAQGANDALLDLKAVQDGGFRLRHLAGGGRRPAVRGAHTRLIDIFLAHADEQTGAGRIGLLERQGRRRADDEQNGEDQNHQPQFAEQQHHDVEDAVPRSGGCIGCRTHEPGNPLESSSTPLPLAR
ncbi:hypothetical protein D3C86_1061360 [compost metagenome]